MLTARLSTLLCRGVSLYVHEAVAIAQLLMHGPGVPTPENVVLRIDGTVSCPDGNPPSVVDMAALLLSVLGPQTRAPGGLRYAIARAMGDVDAPPFDSVDEFSSSLKRFEQGDRVDVVRDLLHRVGVASRSPVAVAVHPRTTPVARAWIWLAAAGALVLSALAGYFLVAHGHHPTPSQRVAAPSSASSEAAGDAGFASAPRSTATAGRMASDLRGPMPALPEDVGQGFSPAFSPDGDALYFHTGRRDDSTSAIAVVSSGARTTDPGEVRIILDDGRRNYHVRPSPDGRSIAFDSDREGTRAVFVANADGTNIRRVSGDGYAAVPTWAPDGRSLAYVRAEPGHPAVWNLWIKPDGGREQRLTHFTFGQTWGASWFPDGRTVALSHERDLLVLDLKTGRSRRLASPVEGALVRTPAVSPDGSRIVFQVANHGAWMVNLADGSMQPVLQDRTAEEFVWSPDGSRVAFHRRLNGRWGIYEVR